MRLYNGTLVVTNGDQTDTIVDYLKQGKSYFEALRTRQFEPDAPNYTSRISGVVNPDWLLQPVHPQELHLGPHRQQAFLL